MSLHDHSHDHDRPQRNFLSSRAGLVLLGFLAIAGLLLVYEHRAHIFVGNWLLVALLVACPLMHIFMHGGHGGHGGHAGHDRQDRDRSKP